MPFSPIKNTPPQKGKTVEIPTSILAGNQARPQGLANVPHDGPTCPNMFQELPFDVEM